MRVGQRRVHDPRDPIALGHKARHPHRRQGRVCARPVVGCCIHPGSSISSSVVVVVGGGGGDNV